MTVYKQRRKRLKIKFTSNKTPYPDLYSQGDHVPSEVTSLKASYHHHYPSAI